MTEAPKRIWIDVDQTIMGYETDPDKVTADDTAYILVADHERLVAERDEAVADWRNRAEFAEAQLAGLLDMLPPPEPDLLKKRLRERAAIRARAEKE